MQAQYPLLCVVALTAVQCHVSTEAGQHDLRDSPAHL